MNNCVLDMFYESVIHLYKKLLFGVMKALLIK
uniref:Uncharacterized protein n=1 Tax=Rhizophora mucronata TaxID=61149 RepID=A0A2P2IKU2_RHIMU